MNRVFTIQATKKKNMETVIILIPIESMSDGRGVLERIEDRVFDSVEALQNEICFDEDDPIAVEDVIIVPITDFMDAWNDSDEDTRRQGWNNIIEPEHIDKYWFGYARIK